MPELDPFDRVHLQEIDGDHPSPALAHARGRDLTPAAGRGAEIDDALTRLHELVLVVDLDELIGRAGAKAFAARLGDIGVVELAFEPAGRRGRALAGHLDPGLERPAALAARAARRHQRSRGAAVRTDPVGAHHVAEDPLAQAPIGDAQPLGREMLPNRLQDGAAGEHQIGAFVADAGVGGALGVAHGAQSRDRRVDLRPAKP